MGLRHALAEAVTVVERRKENGRASWSTSGARVTVGKNFFAAQVAFRTKCSTPNVL
jgi:hypothetical protein